MTDIMKLYRSETGRAFCYRNEGDILLYSPGGAEYFLVETHAWIVKKGVYFDRKERLPFRELFSERYGSLDYLSDTITFDGETYDCVGYAPEDSGIWPLPEIRATDSLWSVIGTDIMLYISVSHHDPSIKKVRVFSGNEEHGYNQLHVTDVKRSMGLIMSIETEYLGNVSRVFLRHKRIEDEAFARHWSGLDLDPLNPEDFVIDERPDGTLSIMPK